jgi:hypothetical protein
MSACTYDNPATMAREFWQDGKLLCSYQAMLLMAKTEIPARNFFFGANVGPWKPGQLFGERSAMKEPK